MGVYTLAERGQTQIQLPNPGRGTTELAEKIGGTHVTLAGSRITETVAVKRTWTLPYPWLSDAQFDVLLSFFDGRRGKGPFELRKLGGAPVLVNVVGSLPAEIQVLGHVSTTLVLAEV